MLGRPGEDLLERTTVTSSGKVGEAPVAEMTAMAAAAVVGMAARCGAYMAFWLQSRGVAKGDEVG